MNRLIAICFLAFACLAANAYERPQAIDDFLDRIGGAGCSQRFDVRLEPDIAPADSIECFSIGTAYGRPCIKASTLSALTAGIGWYLNHYANINLSWSNLVTDLSDTRLPLPESEEVHCTDIRHRHYMNYCTFSYSTTPWTWERWQQEIDWMALHGINLPLQIVGVEEVWRRLLSDYGYTSDEINRFVAGPAYQAWFQMGNVEGIGGPNPDWWYRRQAQLGRKITDRMRLLGMNPVLPGIYFVPSDFGARTGITTYDTGSWCGNRRPHLPDVSSPGFAQFARDFYSHLEEVLGPSDYYSMDPFHESAESIIRQINPDSIYSGLYNALDASHPGAVWVIQHWQWGATQKRCLENVPVGKLLVVDLFADARPAWNNMGRHDVIYSTIFNFGGRTGLFGRVDTTAEGFFKARNSGNVKGIGATPEAIGQTPLIYDMLFELPWYDSAIDTRQWIAEYTTRRYGKADPHAQRAWQLLHKSALACPDPRQGPHEAIMCARPALQVDRASTWGSADIFYDPDTVRLAAFELLQADLDNPNYCFDLAAVSRQALSDYSQTLLAEVRLAHEQGDSVVFEAKKRMFLQLILDVDEILSAVPQFTLEHWTGMSRRVADEAENTGDSDRDWLDLSNARKLITTWHDEAMAESLHDYSYRQWADLLSGFYYHRWKQWFDNGMNPPVEGWYAWEARRMADIEPRLYHVGADLRATVARALHKYLSDDKK